MVKKFIIAAVVVLWGAVLSMAQMSRDEYGGNPLIGQEMEDAAFVCNLLQRGERVSIVYTNLINVINQAGSGSYSCSYPQKGEVTGWAHKIGSTTYIVFSKKDWTALDKECIPSRVSRYWGGVSIAEQVIQTRRQIKTEHGSEILPMTYTWNGDVTVPHKTYTYHFDKYVVVTSTADTTDKKS